jgi:2-methylcitrate dehydratase PrpD
LEESAHAASLNLSGSATTAAFAGLFALGHTRSGTFGASVLSRELDGFFGSRGNFFQR